MKPTAELASAGYAAIGYGKITAYKVEVSEDGTNWSPLVEIKDPKEDLTYTWDNEKNELSTKAKDDDNGKITLVHASLSQGETKYYRVSTVNNAATNKATSVPSNGLKATTDGALIADSPGGLVVKAEGLFGHQVALEREGSRHRCRARHWLQDRSLAVEQRRG